MSNKQDKRTQIITELFETACNTLAAAVNRQLFDGTRKWHWVGDSIGGVCDFGGTDFLSPEDMTRILKHGVTFEEYDEWCTSNLDHEQHINLASWLKGVRH